MLAIWYRSPTDEDSTMTDHTRTRFLLPGAVGLLLIVSLACGRLSAAEAARVFRAGAATANITPPLGEKIVGNWEPIPATHVHDELHARCLVLDDGQTTLAFVVCDNVGIPREVFDAARDDHRRRNRTAGRPPAVLRHAYAFGDDRPHRKQVRRRRRVHAVSAVSHPPHCRRRSRGAQQSGTGPHRAGAASTFPKRSSIAAGS